MKMNLPKNWIAKVLSFLLAVAIWFLIRDHLKEGGGNPSVPPRAIVVPEPGRK